MIAAQHHRSAASRIDAVADDGSAASADAMDSNFLISADRLGAAAARIGSAALHVP